MRATTDGWWVERRQYLARTRAVAQRMTNPLTTLAAMEPTTSSPPVRIAVLGSGSGTTVARLLDAAGSTIHAKICLVISNNSRSGVLAHARQHDVPTLHLSSAAHADPVALDAAMVDALASMGAELVVLAGYMKKIGPRTLVPWPCTSTTSGCDPSPQVRTASSAPLTRNLSSAEAELFI